MTPYYEESGSVNDNLIAIAMVEPTSALEQLADDAPLADRFRCAFKAVQRHWMVTDPEKQYRAAVGAVYTLASEDERERIEAEMQSLNALNAMLSGLPIDLDRVETPDDPIGIMKLWYEVVEA